MNTSRCCSKSGWIDDLEYAKISCGKSTKCIGIEVRDHRYASICMDAACTSKPLKSDGNSMILFLKKIEVYGKIKIRRYLKQILTLKLITFRYNINQDVTISV